MNLKSLFPHGSNAFFSANSPVNSQLPPAESKPITSNALGRKSKRETQIRGRIRVCYRLSSVRPLDTDNLAGAVKIGQDCLVAVGLFPNDDPYSIEVSFKQVKVKHFADEKLEIEITK